MSKALWHLLNLSNEEALTDFYHENLSAPRAISISPEDFLLLFQKRPEPFTVTPKTVTITNLNTAREARCNHTWECRLALVGSNIVVTLGYLTVHGSCDLAQGRWRYDHSKTTTTL